MKHLTTILLTLISFCLYAQSPTYDQTVDFIKTNCVGRMLYEGPLDSFQRETGHKLTKVEIQKNGTIKLVAYQQHGRHDFDIVFNIFDLKSSIDYPDGIRAYKYLVHFQGLNVSKGYGITFATTEDAKRVARAFRHLKTMCSKQGSLFDAPTQTEKKATLTKEETIKYIKNAINKQETIKHNYQSNQYDISQDYSINLYSNTFYKESTITKYDRDDKTYYYKESKYEYKQFMDNIESAELVSGKKYYEVGLKFNKSFIKSETETAKYRTSYDFMNTLDKAKETCYSKSWKPVNFEGQLRSGKYLSIIFKNESDAKRLVKAFNHLAALIKEERQNAQDDDPFGN